MVHQIAFEPQQDRALCRYHLNGSKHDRPRVHDVGSGRKLEVSTTQSGTEIYTGGFFAGDTVDVGECCIKYAAFTMENQGYPEAINHPAVPSSILRPGGTYDTTTAAGAIGFAMSPVTRRSGWA